MMKLSILSFSYLLTNFVGWNNKYPYKNALILQKENIKCFGVKFELYFHFEYFPVKNVGFGCR